MYDRDYAKEFKDALEKQDNDPVEIIDQWMQSSPDDANLGLAMVILGSLNENIELKKTFEFYLQVIQDKPENESLFDWFNGTAISLMEKRADDEMGFSEMFNNKYKSNRPSNNYAREFLNLFEEIVEKDGAGDLEKLHELADEWEENYPEDANMHCAHVVLNIRNISGDELEDRVKKAKEMTPGDKNSYPKLLTLMNAVCRAK